MICKLARAPIARSRDSCEHLILGFGLSFRTRSKEIKLTTA